MSKRKRNLKKNYKYILIMNNPISKVISVVYSKICGLKGRMYLV